MKKVIKNINHHLNILNNSKMFTGLVMLMLNIGSKFITIKLSNSQEAYIRNYVAKELLVFSICWMGTRDIYTAFVLTFVFFVITQHLFNEESRFCILPHHYRQFHLLDKNQDGVVSQEEIDDAIKVLKKAKEKKDVVEQDELYNYFK
jgi:hypothetical protein